MPLDRVSNTPCAGVGEWPAAKLPAEKPTETMHTLANAARHKTQPDSRRAGSRPHMGAATLHKSDAFGGVRALDGDDFQTRLQPHVHAPYVLGVVDAGRLCVTCNGRSYIATPGSVVALPPFTVHTELPLDGRGWSFRYLYPSAEVVREALRLPNDFSGTALPFASPVFADALLARAISQVHALLADDGNACDVEGALAHALRMARERHCATTQLPIRSARQHRAIAAVREILTAGPLQRVTIRDLARIAGLSPFHFARVFRAEVGLAPYAYYERVRVAFAHELLQEGNDVSAVAYRLGFADQSHLTRHFRTGSFTTPGQLAGMARKAAQCGHAAVHNPRSSLQRSAARDDSGFEMTVEAHS